MIENWRPVVGYEDRYEVSDLGRVRSLDRVVVRTHHGRREDMQRLGKILRPARSSSGKLRVCLSNHGQQVRLVHHLVLEAFIGPRPRGLHGCHYNDVPDDNRLDNLRWDTRSANTFDAVRNGRHHLSRRRHCKRRHEFSQTNTRLRRDGSRACRQCERDRKKSAECPSSNYSAV